MKNIKGMKEQHNSLLDAADKILNNCLAAKRNMNKAEISEYETLQIKAADLRQEIEASQAEARSGQKTKERQEVRKMEKRELQAKEEIRAITTSTHEEVVPTGLATEIVKKLQENSQIFAAASTIEYAGKYQMNREDAEISEAAMLEENEEITDTPVANLKPLILSDKRCGSLVKVSENVLLNAPSMGIEYISSVLGRRVAKTLDKQIFASTGTGVNFTGSILKDGVVFNAAALTIDTLIAMVADMNPMYLKGAKWYMNRELFKQVQAFKMSTGEFYVVPDTREGLSYKLLGIEIVVCEAAEQICLVNPLEAILIKINKGGFNVRQLKEVFALTSEVGFLVNLFIDGGLKNPAATRVLKVGATKAAK